MTLEPITLHTPIGTLHGGVEDGALAALGFERGTTLEKLQARHGFEIAATAGAATRRVETQLRRYFDGDVAALDDVPVAPVGGTPFQRRVWTTLRSIPTGQTLSYRDLARRIRNPKAVRAVGSANGANPVPIVLPCHRVIAANGTLGGYGGGLPVKRWLLKHEGVVVNGA